MSPLKPGQGKLDELQERVGGVTETRAVNKYEERAQLARKTAYDLGDLLYEKQMAYGDSGSAQLAIWEARLRPYLTEDGEHYKIPRALIAHIPRLTRVDDRIARLISNPAGDRMKEDPWLDMAGDAVIGVIMPKKSSHTGLAEFPCHAVHPVYGLGCERSDLHTEHRYLAGGGTVVRWSYNARVDERQQELFQHEGSPDPGETGKP